MPDFAKCVKFRGRYYCWNADTDRLNEITVREIALSDCPDEVLKTMIREPGGAPAGLEEGKDA